MKAGMGKSRTVRHRIPNIPPVSRIGGKNRNRKLPEKYGQERERKWLRRFPARIFGFPYRAGKIPAGIPVPLPHFGPFLPISAAQPNSATRAQRAPKFGSAPRSPAPQTLKAPNFSPFPPHISRPPPHSLSESQSLSPADGSLALSLGARPLRPPADLPPSPSAPPTGDRCRAARSPCSPAPPSSSPSRRPSPTGAAPRAARRPASDGESRTLAAPRTRRPCSLPSSSPQARHRHQGCRVNEVLVLPHRHPSAGSSSSHYGRRWWCTAPLFLQRQPHVIFKINVYVVH